MMLLDHKRMNLQETYCRKNEATAGRLHLALILAASLSMVDFSYGASLDNSQLELVNSGSRQLVGDSANILATVQLTRLKRQAKKNKKGNKQLEIECLAAHNKFRRQHKVPDLQWDSKLADFAQKRSNHIAASDGAAFGHPPDLPFGENLFWHSSEQTGCDFMVRGWYDEINLYNFDNPTFAAETGHFTQVVWRDTKRVGCAVAISSGKRGGIYLTCSYDPAGNFLGEFVDNVPRPGASASSSNANVTKPVSPSIIPTTALTTTTTTATTTTTTLSTTSLPTIPTTTQRPAIDSSSDKITTKPKSKKKKNNKKKKNKDKNKKKNKKKKKNKNKKKTDSLVLANSTSSSTITPILLGR